MPYATPQRYAAEFGVGESAQLLAATQPLVTDVLLGLALAGTLPTAPVGGDEPISQADIDDTVAAMARFNRKLVDVSNFMDGYLRSAVVLPMDAAHASAGTLEECCLALTRSSLAVSAAGATERMDEEAARWRAWLKDVQAGRVQLVDSATGESPVMANRIRSGSTRSRYDWAFNRRFGA